MRRSTQIAGLLALDLAVWAAAGCSASGSRSGEPGSSPLDAAGQVPLSDAAAPLSPSDAGTPPADAPPASDGTESLPPGQPPIIAGTVTLRGNVFCSQHLGQPAMNVYLTALDGPPEIQQQVSSVLANYYPSKGSLGGDAARALQNQFNQRLTYNVDGPPANMLFGEVQYTGRSIYALTGEISAKDGGTWLTISGYAANAPFQYPANMLAPDVPLSPPSKPPLVLDIGGGMTMTFIYVAAGKFLMGEPYYICPSWQEDPPHLVTITKGYYLAEAPITWGQYLAAVGVDLRTGGEDAQAAADVTCANTYAFAKALATHSGRKVRPPTSAELVYAFRVGTSNPPFAAKYSGAGIVAQETAPVAATPPNPWGFYEWMTDIGWERSGDLPVSEHADVVDPSYTPPEDLSDPTKPHQHAGYGRSEYPIGELEYITNEIGPVGTYPNLIRERMVVEE